MTLSFLNHFIPNEAVKPLKLKCLLCMEEYKKHKILIRGENNKSTTVKKSDDNS